MKKKTIALIISAAMCMSAFAAPVCASDNVTADTELSKAAAEEETEVNEDLLDAKAQVVFYQFMDMNQKMQEIFEIVGRYMPSGGISEEQADMADKAFNTIDSLVNVAKGVIAEAGHSTVTAELIDEKWNAIKEKLQEKIRQLREIGEAAETETEAETMSPEEAQASADEMEENFNSLDLEGKVEMLEGFFEMYEMMGQLAIESVAEELNLGSLIELMGIEISSEDPDESLGQEKLSVAERLDNVAQKMEMLYSVTDALHKVVILAK